MRPEHTAHKGPYVGLGASTALAGWGASPFVYLTCEQLRMCTMEDLGGFVRRSVSGDWWWGFTHLSGFCQQSLACFGQGRCKDVRGAPGHILVSRSSEQASNGSPSHRAHARNLGFLSSDAVGGCTVSLQVQPASAGELTPPGLPTAKGVRGGAERLCQPSGALVVQF